LRKVALVAPTIAVGVLIELSNNVETLRMSHGNIDVADGSEWRRIEYFPALAADYHRTRDRLRRAAPPTCHLAPKKILAIEMMERNSGGAV